MKHNSQPHITPAHSVKPYVKVVRSLVGAMRAYQSGVVLQNLTVAQFHILDRLAEAAGGVHQKQLVEASETAKPSGLSALLRRMEDESSWIHREIDRDNRRTMKVTLTPKGRKAWEEAAPVYHELLQRKLGAYKPETLERLIADLEALREKLIKK